MSQNHYEDISDSDEEGKLVIDETPRVKKVTKRRKATEDLTPPTTPDIVEPASRKKVRVLDSDDEAPSTSKGKKRSVVPKPNVSPAAKISRKLLDQNEMKWQKAMDVAVSFLVPLKVDIKDLTLLPDAGTMECFRKGVQSWLNEQKRFVPLTFSTQKSLQTVVARFVFDFVLRAAEICPSDWNPNGCVVWEHKTNEEKLYCLHGLPMINKEQIVEMDINSENGQRALKESPERAKIVTNKWGRSVVQMKNADAMCCFYDLKSSLNSFSSESCGYFYSDGNKARQGFYQIRDFVKAMYPQMPKAGEMLLMPLVCECNYGHHVIPLLGKQTCKVTPFALNAVSNIDRSLVEDAKVLATLNNPVVLVFQCCNPVYRNTKANPQKNCDFKISSTDVVMALQLAKQMWSSLTGTKASIVVQEFKWQPQYRVQNTLLPTGQDDADECLF